MLQTETAKVRNNGAIIIAALLCAFGTIGVFGYEQLASYRSRAFCAALGRGDIPLGELPAGDMASTQSGHQRIVVVHRGILPGSRYVCQADAEHDKLTSFGSDHRWSFEHY
jgi:hypothetical protein